MAILRIQRLVVLAVLSLSACNLSDKIERPNFDDRDEGAEEDMSSTEDVRSDAADSSIPDMPVGDMTPQDMGEPDLPDEPLTAANFYEQFLREMCRAFLRVDFQPNDYYWWDSAASCMQTLELSGGLQRQFVEDDIADGRVTVDLTQAAALLDRIGTFNKPADFQTVDLSFVLLAQQNDGTPCATDFACLDVDGADAVCLKLNDAECLGVCGPRDRFCETEICAPDEVCARPRDSAWFCVQPLADGATCMQDQECLNYCLRDSGNTVGSCGLLGRDDDCSNAFDACGPNLYCDSRTCRPTLPDGANCVNSVECAATSVCSNGGTCVPIGVGTLCRDGECINGLDCIRQSTADATFRCYDQRQNGDPCVSDANCPSSSFCDAAQNPPVCAARRGANLSCRSTSGCVSGLVCQFAMEGALTGQCQQRQWGLAEREVCFDKTATCSFGLFCEKDSATSLRGQCESRERPGNMDPCEVPFECVDSYCAGARCSTQRSAGSSCTEDRICESAVCDLAAMTCVDRATACN